MSHLEGKFCHWNLVKSLHAHVQINKQVFWIYVTKAIIVLLKYFIRQIRGPTCFYQYSAVVGKKRVNPNSKSSHQTLNTGGKKLHHHTSSLKKGYTQSINLLIRDGQTIRDGTEKESDVATQQKKGTLRLLVASRKFHRTSVAPLHEVTLQGW